MQSRVNDLEVSAYLDNIAATISGAALALDSVDGEPPKTDPYLDVYDGFRVMLVHDPIPNAWTHGDDFACLSTSLFLEAEHPEEIAFVLSHEFGHIENGHLVQSVERRKGNEILAGAVLVLGAAAAGLAASDPYSNVDTSQMMENAADASRSILASYSPHRRQDEFEADAQAIELMATAGYRLDRCGDWFEHMISMYGPDSGSESHPPTQERLERIQELVAERKDYQPTRQLSVEQFHRMQDRIRALTIQSLQTDTLAFFTIESLERESAGESAPHAKACGPLGADVNRMVKIYTEQLFPEE